MAQPTARAPVGIPATLKVSGKEIHYSTFTLHTTADPLDNFGEVGDLCKNASGSVYVRGSEGWSEGLDEETMNPLCKSVLVCTSRSGKPRWVVPSTIRGRKSKAKSNEVLKHDRVEEEGEEGELSSRGSRKRSRVGCVDSAYPAHRKPEHTDETTFSSPPVYGNPDNTWIQPLRSEWSSPPFCHLPRSKDGQKILDALLNYPNSIPPYEHLLAHGDLYHGQGPSMEHVVTDLIHVDENKIVIVDQSAGYGTGAHKEQVLVSMWRSEHAKADDSDVKLYSIPDLPFHEKGSAKCDINLPKCFLERAVVDAENGKDTWSTTFCPPGSITDIHWDYHGASQVMLGISTRKLWLLWPPTQKNLEWWRKHNTRQATGSDTLEAIQKLEGLNVVYQKGRQAFLMPPFHLHAVLTFEVSAHCGTAIWDHDSWKNTARQVTEWEYSWARDYFQNGFSQEDAQQTFLYLNHSISRWDKLHKKLVKKNTVSKSDLKELGEWVKTFQKKLSQGLRLLQ